MSILKITKIDLENVIKDSLSWRQVCKRLGYYPDGANNIKIKSLATFYQIDFSHFLGKAIWKGRKSPQKLATDVFLKKLPDRKISTHKLRLRLIEDGLRKNECESCRNELWNGKPIPLELHHIDGNNLNNQIENLQILCPNCHAQTPNYGVRNIKR